LHSYWLTSCWNIFHLCGDATIHGEGCIILAYCVGAYRRRGSLSCHTLSNTGPCFCVLIQRTAHLVTFYMYGGTCGLIPYWSPY
jgi:hypothetical protein